MVCSLKIWGNQQGNNNVSIYLHVMTHSTVNFYFHWMHLLEWKDESFDYLLKFDFHH